MIPHREDEWRREPRDVRDPVSIHITPETIREERWPYYLGAALSALALVAWWAA